MTSKKELATENLTAFKKELFLKRPKDAQEAHSALNNERIQFRTQWQARSSELANDPEYAGVTNSKELLGKWYAEIAEPGSAEGLRQGEMFKLIDTILHGEPINDPATGQVKEYSQAGLNQPFEELIITTATSQSSTRHESMTASIENERSTLLASTAFALRAILETHVSDLNGEKLLPNEARFAQKLELADFTHNETPITIDDLQMISSPKKVAKILKSTAFAAEEMRTVVNHVVNEILVGKLRTKYTDSNLGLAHTREIHPDTSAWKTKYGRLVALAQPPLPTDLNPGDINPQGIRHALINAQFYKFD